MQCPPGLCAHVLQHTSRQSQQAARALLLIHSAAAHKQVGVGTKSAVLQLYCKHRTSQERQNTPQIVRTQPLDIITLYSPYYETAKANAKAKQCILSLIHQPYLNGCINHLQCNIWSSNLSSRNLCSRLLMPHAVQCVSSIQHQQPSTFQRHTLPGQHLPQAALQPATQGKNL